MVLQPSADATPVINTAVEQTEASTFVAFLEPLLEFILVAGQFDAGVKDMLRVKGRPPPVGGSPDHAKTVESARPTLRVIAS